MHVFLKRKRVLRMTVENMILCDEAVREKVTLAHRQMGKPRSICRFVLTRSAKHPTRR